PFPSFFVPPIITRLVRRPTMGGENPAMSPAETGMIKGRKSANVLSLSHFLDPAKAPATNINDTKETAPGIALIMTMKYSTLGFT
ncbi:MAG: hypothetical protein ACLFO3_07455, partial [Candidatus Acetothermia bacterium]